MSLPPDATLGAIAPRMLGLWQELDSLYDEIEQRLRSARLENMTPLAERMRAIEIELGPLLADASRLRQGAEALDPEVAPMLREAEAILGRLADRQPRLARASIVARDTVLARLARTRIGRAQTLQYRPSTSQAARFASRRV